MATEDFKLKGELADTNPEPQKFIRTFAGDAEALKEGGVPDLVPYGGQAAPAPPSADDSLYTDQARPLPPRPRAERVAEPDAVVSRAPEPAVPPFTPAEPVSSREEVSPPVLAFVPSAVHEPPPKKTVSETSPIETYSSDFTDRVSESGASTFTVLAAQEDAGHAAVEAPRHTLANVMYISISLVLLAVGAAGAYAAYLRYEQGRAPVPILQTISAPIFVDERAPLPGTGAVLERAVAQSVATAPAEGTVRLLYTTDATSTDNNIFIDMQLAAPGELVRNLELSGSMVGVTTLSGEASPFFILPVASYADTFAGMLDWEPTMPESLALLFPRYPSTAVASSTAATSSMAVSASQPVGTFVDKIVANHNTREYQDASGRTVVLYGYWNQSVLIIARNEAVFTEVVNRLANSRSSS